jgi:riboflavin kinase / FMN adenylyltransferase
MIRLFRDVAGPCLAPRGSVVCIGAFDGVHRGHRAVIDHVRDRAAALNLDAIAVSFDPIPRLFFARDAGVPQLSSPTEKVGLLIDAGVQRVLLLRFNAAMAAMPAEDFIARVLVSRLRAREVWVGENFRFGNARRGDLNMLARVGKAQGFAAQSIESVVADGACISSSRIRGLLAESDFAAANGMLGRAFAIGGHVVHGQKLGRKLGYPTANLRLGSRISPVQGIFAVRVHDVGDRPMPAVASLGMRPTVSSSNNAGKEPLLEAHLFDFDGDLYGKKIKVEFVEKLRAEEKFDSLDAMVQQIHRDAAQARKILDVPDAIKSAVIPAKAGIQRRSFS